VIFQYDKDLRPVNTDGCYFISLGKISEEITAFDLSVNVLTLGPKEIMEVYAEAVYEGHMKWNCFIKEPDEILHLFLEKLKVNGLEVQYIGWWNADMPSDKPLMFDGWKESDVTHEIHRHSTATGKHFKTPSWDPYPELKRGPLDGRRLFRVSINGPAVA
jgi:hypothetical protein